jgi:hypothetical protein
VVTPHVAQNHARAGGSAIDARTTRHAGYKISQKKRKRIEECFGWLKTVAGLRKLRHRGVAKWTGFSLSPARPTTSCACETWRPQFRRCKSGPEVCLLRQQSDGKATKTPLFPLPTPTNDEKWQEQQRIR